MRQQTTYHIFSKTYAMLFLNLLLTLLLVLSVLYIARLKLREQVTDSDVVQVNISKLQVSNCDVMQYLRDSTDMIRPLLEHKQITFSVQCSPESMMGWIDTNKMDKILLLTFADCAKHTTANGKVAMSTQANERYDAVTIHISDTGEQMKMVTIQVVQQVVRHHRGTLSYQYYEGQGNRLAMTIPITKEAYQLVEGKQDTSPDFHIPDNIALHVPDIDLPTGISMSGAPLTAIIRQAYVSTDQEFLKRAIQCVNDHLSDSEYDRERFAQDMGTSVSTLYNKIRALTGKNVTNFLRDIRIQAACRMAREHPELRVSDIAYQVGYKDPKYFATSFKRVTGKQPKEYLLGVRSEE